MRVTPCGATGIRSSRSQTVDGGVWEKAFIPRNVDKPPIKYKIKEVPSEFLKDTNNAEKLIEWIDGILRIQADQEMLDTEYDKLVTIFHNEMKQFFKPVQNGKKSKKAFKHSTKEWWDDTAYNKWQIMHQSEIAYLKCPRQNPRNKQLRDAFVSAQYTFDKYIKKKKGNICVIK